MFVIALLMGLMALTFWIVFALVGLVFKILFGVVGGGLHLIGGLFGLIVTGVALVVLLPLAVSMLLWLALPLIVLAVGVGILRRVLRWSREAPLEGRVFDQRL